MLQLKSSIWSIDGILTGTTTPGHRGAESNDNERVIHIFPTPALPANATFSQLQPYRQMQLNVVSKTWYQVLLSNNVVGQRNPQ